MSAPAAPVADWLDALDGPLREPLRSALASLPLISFERLPPPKRGGFPLGRELSILTRRLSGRSCQLHPSAAASLYARAVGARERLAYRALALGEALPAGAWRDLVGAEALDAWRRGGLLEPGAADSLACRFRVVCIGGLPLVVDPLNVRFPNRVHIGLDSLAFVELLDRQRLPRAGRALDVGTGSGVALLHLATRGAHEQLVGIDLNPRAVALARFNAELVGQPGCRFEALDVFAAGEGPGLFDVVTWNTPYRFFPESLRRRSVDGYGGHLGIEISLRFVERLPALLAEGGVAWLKSSGPVLRDGTRPMDEELAERASRLGLDVAMTVAGSEWDPRLADFYAAHRVVDFESLFLRLERGAGRVSRAGPGWGTRVTDRLLRWLADARARRIPVAS